MTFKEIQDALKNLITEKSTPEMAEQVGKISSMVESTEKEVNELIEKQDALRIKYVEAVKNSSFGGTPTPAIAPSPEKPKTLEECLLEAQSK